MNERYSLVFFKFLENIPSIFSKLSVFQLTALYLLYLTWHFIRLMYFIYFSNICLFNVGSFYLEFLVILNIIFNFVHKCNKGHIIFQIKSIKVEYITINSNSNILLFITFYECTKLIQIAFNIFYLVLINKISIFIKVFLINHHKYFFIKINFHL